MQANIQKLVEHCAPDSCKKRTEYEFAMPHVLGTLESQMSCSTLHYSRQEKRPSPPSEAQAQGLSNCLRPSQSRDPRGRGHTRPQTVFSSII